MTFKSYLTIKYSLYSIFVFDKKKMLKFTSSIFFTILFMAFISAPSIILLTDNSEDVSIFYSLSEEEEKGHETLKNIEVFNSELSNSEFIFASQLKSKVIGYSYKTYPKPHLNLISPPPEVHIL